MIPMHQSDEQLKRRAMDLYEFDIESLIAAEPDPKQRVILIVVNNLNRSIVTNTEMTKSVSGKLDMHLTNFENYTKDKDALLNRGKGAWQVAVYVMALIQVIGLGTWNSFRTELSDLHATDAKIVAMVQEVKK